MEIKKMKLFFTGLIAMGLSIQPLFSQDKIIREYADANKQKAYAFYPSTLRMVNIKNNEAYNEMVSGINKLLIFALDSTATASKSYIEVVKKYGAIGFEEYAAVWGSFNIFIYGKEGRNREIVGVFGENDQSFAFYLDGEIGWQKVPELINTLEANDMLNLFELRAMGSRHD